MSKLIAFVFDDPYNADEARATVRRMGGEGLLEIDETAVLIRQADGKTQVSQDLNVIARNRQVGHVLGLVAAAITGTMPLVLVGTLSGTLVGKLTDNGITNRFIRGVENKLQPGTSAMILLARSDPERARKVLKRLRQWSPIVLQSNLPPEVERDVVAALQGGAAQPDRKAA